MAFKLLDINPGYLSAITELWNAACGQSLAISDRLARFNLGAATGANTAGRLAKQEGRPVGFVIASATTRPVDGLSHPSGWIDALAVTPEAQGQGAGSQLISWAEGWLRAHGCPRARLGGGLRPFAPGLPVRTGSASFFLNRGYTPRPDESTVWDVARCLDNYVPPASLRFPQPDVRPLSSSDVDVLDNFLAREFPGRWRFEFREHLRMGGRLADFLVLKTPKGIEGFCQITLEDSIRPIERFYMHGLTRPWGQMGPIGVSAARRGQGFGMALLDAGLRFLRERGVSGCLIDWTSLPAFYQKFGFQLHNEYFILNKELNRYA